MKTKISPHLHFDVSSGLKSVLGSELITDDEVAIFELVKNSFDASASQVDLYFGDDEIIIADNGAGMSYDDILNKWLFVAYSSKRTNTDDFRNEIADRRQYAGSKGIGRFSSDRLGGLVTLQTRSKREKSGPVHCVVVDWTLFDVDHRDRFEEIGVQYFALPKGFVIPKEIPKRTVGTVIKIEQPRRIWDRQSILTLKSALAKLINPFGSSADGFKILVHSPTEKSTDEKVLANTDEAEMMPNSLVNGPVGNFIFSTLQEKTTFIDVRINPAGNFVESSLTDRGERIYEIREPNKYPLLQNSGFRCQLFFLNTSAKMTFARRMGIPSVQFGSVFLFRNGFRVYPIGKDGDDWYKIDRRKQQGYNRFLGTREVIGRVDVAGHDEYFQEASSRNAGLIETPAVIQLRDFFIEYCLKRLERYVVPVTYADKEDRVTSDVSRLLTDPGKARVAAAVARLVDNDGVELLDYSKRLIGLLNERSSQFEGSLLSLRAIAQKTKDKQLFKNIEDAELKFQEVKRSEEEARRQADLERTAKEAAQARAEEAERLSVKVSEELAEEKKRSLFLSSIATLDTTTILNLHHQVTIYAVDIQQQIDNFLLPTVSRLAAVPTVSISRSDIAVRDVIGV